MLVNIFHRGRCAPSAATLGVLVWNVQRQHYRCCSVPQIVEANVRQAVLPQDRLETLVKAVALDVDHALCRGFLLGGGQLVQDVVRSVHRPGGAGGLGALLDPLVVLIPDTGLPDRHRAPLEVHAVPGQAGDLR